MVKRRKTGYNTNTREPRCAVPASGADHGEGYFQGYAHHFIVIKASTYQKNMIILSVNPANRASKHRKQNHKKRTLKNPTRWETPVTPFHDPSQGRMGPITRRDHMLYTKRVQS